MMEDSSTVSPPPADIDANPQRFSFPFGLKSGDVFGSFGKLIETLDREKCRRHLSGRMGSYIKRYCYGPKSKKYLRLYCSMCKVSIRAIVKGDRILVRSVNRQHKHGTEEYLNYLCQRRMRQASKKKGSKGQQGQQGENEQIKKKKEKSEKEFEWKEATSENSPSGPGDHPFLIRSEQLADRTYQLFNRLIAKLSVENFKVSVALESERIPICVIATRTRGLTMHSPINVDLIPNLLASETEGKHYEGVAFTVGTGSSVILVGLCMLARSRKHLLQNALVRFIELYCLGPANFVIDNSCKAMSKAVKNLITISMSSPKLVIENRRSQLEYVQAEIRAKFDFLRLEANEQLNTAHHKVS